MDLFCKYKHRRKLIIGSGGKGTKRKEGRETAAWERKGGKERERERERERTLSHEFLFMRPERGN